jgi:glycerol kinase
MPEALLAIDAGTTSVRVIIVGLDGAIRMRVRESLPISYPAPGRVEQDAEHIFSTTRMLLRQALRESKLRAADVAALGVTTQRASCVVWERATGRALTPLISWQDLRGAARSAELREAGFFVMPQSAAAKLEAALDTVPDGRRRADAGELAWGNIDAYLVYRLSGGALHATDPSQACATAYFDYATGGWDAALIAAQRVPQEMFPRLVDTAGRLGETAPDALGAPVPIAAIVGDQQCAALAEGCRAPGDGKVTYGTSATADVHTGREALTAPGTYPLVLCRRGGATEFCIEGMVITAGAVLDWLSGGLGLLDDPAQASAVGAEAEDSGGVFVLPAFQGLGSPHGDATRCGLITGLTRGTRREHLVRAMLEGIAFRVRDVLDAIYGGTGLPCPPALRVDGGASANDLLMQLQADILGRPVERMAPIEATAFGAALLAGEGVGLIPSGGTAALRRVDRLFRPTWSEAERDERYSLWRVNCGLA